MAVIPSQHHVLTVSYHINNILGFYSLKSSRFVTRILIFSGYHGR
jgi:hypothetical protein